MFRITFLFGTCQLLTVVELWWRTTYFVWSTMERGCMLRQETLVHGG